MPHRPIALTVLGGLQFVGFAVGCVVLLGNGTLDGALTVADVVLAVAVALVGALVVGSTFGGGRVGWWFELVLGVVVIAAGGLLAAAEDTFGLPLLALGVVWLGIAAIPQSRSWFLRP